MSRSRSSDSVSPGQLLLRVSIPLLIVAGAAVACYVVIDRMTANISSGGGPAGVTRHVEAEWIPKAVMGSLLPGRFEFEQGDDDVVVISRILEKQPLEMSEIDRLWLQLPVAMEVGKPIDLEQLHSETRLGFDRGIYSKGIFAELPSIEGTVTLRQRHAQWLVLEMSARLGPVTGPAWVLEDHVVAFLTPQGRHALQANGSKEASPVLPHGTPSPVANIVGQWHGELVDARGGSALEVYYQFNADGRFAHSTCRGGGSGAGYSAGMKYGKWSLRGDRLVMRTETYVFDEPKNNDHMDHLQGHPLIILKVKPIDETITFEGYFQAPGNADLRLPGLRRTHVPDLFTHRPNPNRKPGFFQRPMPSPAEVVPRGVVVP